MKEQINAMLTGQGIGLGGVVPIGMGGNGVVTILIIILVVLLLTGRL